MLQFGVPSASTTHATPPGSTHATPPGSSHSTLFSGLTFTAPVLRHSPGASPPLGVTPPTQQASSEGKKTRSPVAGFKPTFHAAQLASVSILNPHCRSLYLTSSRTCASSSVVVSCPSVLWSHTHQRYGLIPISVMVM